MKALYSIAEIKELLSEYGFAVTEHLGAEDMTEQYFAYYGSKGCDVKKLGDYTDGGNTI